MPKRVIIIDDDPALMKTAHGVFARSGIAFTCAPGEYEASVAMIGPAPTHVILDPDYRKINALDLINRIAALPVRPALILLSQGDYRVLEATKQAALGKGIRIVSAARKPVSANELQALLANTRDAMPDKPTIQGAPAAVNIEDMQTAIRRDQFQFVYQPRIECKTGRLTGFEALARWQDTEPRDFITAAEKNGLIRMLTRRLAAKGIRWLGERFPDNDCTLSINLSPDSITDNGLPEYLVAVCRQFRVTPSRIVLEISEPAAENGEAALEQVVRFRLKGFPVALDDAGAGYSSLEQLLRLPFSELEIDRTFVRRMAMSEECRQIVDTMIRLGHRLELVVTGKGVETADALAYLAEHGCDHAQGYFIARPLDPGAAAAWQPAAR